MFKKNIFILSTLLLAACNDNDNAAPPVIVAPTSPPVVVDPFANVTATATTNLAASCAGAVSIAIMKGDEIVYAEAFGNTIKGGAVVPDSNTLFQLGSTTKMFTATAALQLVDEEILTLDESLTVALPGLVGATGVTPGWADITMDDLMTHQSGFEDYLGLDGPAGIHRMTPLMEFVLQDYPVESGQMNPAGKFFNYSNPGFVYVGAVVENLRAQPYENVIENHVFEPLGMPRATMDHDTVLLDGNYALGVSGCSGTTGTAQTELGEVAVIPYMKPVGSYAWTTPSEMMQMGKFILNGDTSILSEEQHEKMVSPHVRILDGVPLYYAYALFVKDQGKMIGDQWLTTPMIDHGGDALSYTSIFWTVKGATPADDIIISVLSSGDHTDFTDTAMAALGSVMEVPALVEPPFFPTQPALDDAHIGDYYSMHSATTGMEVVRQVDDKLYIRLLGASGVSPTLRELTAYAGSVFHFDISGSTESVSMVPLLEGETQTVYIRNRSYVGNRFGLSSNVARPFVLNQQNRPFSMPR
ncbi:MAG: CubicO group peptidase (beta-lactamase class C family) [Phenylobacterium sp.]|jgi:CubicO group peptidase (beta-lactamase class C family)